MRLLTLLILATGVLPVAVPTAQANDSSVIREIVTRYGLPKSIDENETSRITVLNYETWGIRIVDGTAEEPTSLVDWVADDREPEAKAEEAEEEPLTKKMKRHSELRDGERFFDTEKMVEMLKDTK